MRDITFDIPEIDYLQLMENSYVSLEYALQHHSLIPKAVRVVTSNTAS